MKPAIKTPIAYYGGKQAIIHHILPLIPEHKIYTEVFFGGGTVFFAKEPAQIETINDRLDIVINFYRQLKTNFPELQKLIDQTLISRTMHLEALSIIREKKAADNIHRAWAFWMCSNFSFANKLGGGIKYSNCQSSVPPLTLKNKKTKFTKDLVKRIENATIENNDALIILRSRNKKNAFHYLDPPYPNADQGYYSGYGWDEYQKLLNWCQNECKGKFLLSSYNSEMLDDYILRNNWNKKEITRRLKAPRKRIEAKTEVLVWNYEINDNLFSQ